MQPGGIEVWTAQPDQLGAGECTQFTAMLDAHERQRAHRYRHQADRRAFIAAHALRRMALGRAMARDPADLRFGKGTHGQPVLLDGGAHPPAFSLTRRRGLVACAVGRAGALGIDVETMTGGFHASLLEPFMVCDKQAPLTEEDFCVRWTALEAFWKSRGLGLSTANPRIALRAIEDMDGFEVLFAGGSLVAATIALRLPVAAGHVLSIACEEADDIRLVAVNELAAAPLLASSKNLFQVARMATARYPRHPETRTRNVV